MSHTFTYHDTTLSIAPGQSWCFWGSNISGIEEMYHSIASELPEAGFISSQILQEIYEEEMAGDDTDFMDRIDIGTTVREFLPAHSEAHPLVKRLNFDDLMERGYRQLSSGQSKKLLILREILNGKKTLVLYNPYDGLDVESCAELHSILHNLVDEIEIIVLVQNREDIPRWTSHLGIFTGEQLSHHGPMQDTITKMPELKACTRDIDIVKEEQAPETLLIMRKGFAAYGDNTLFTGLDLSIATGEHTLITGHNGCGKSTLLHIITGDNSKCYANDMELFGKKRGSGESIWELKKDIGIVSPELHRNHRCAGSALEILLGGLHDSIGLYKRPTRVERLEGEKWFEWLEMSHLASKPFRRLSFAEQRMILIGRGLIKMPKLLILDEPTQGLDEEHRLQVLFLMEKIAREKLSTIVFVSHRQDEHRDFFVQTIPLETYKQQSPQEEQES